MKKLILAPAAILFFGLTVFNMSNCKAQTSSNSEDELTATQQVTASTPVQDLKYQVRGRYMRPVKQEQLSKAKLLSDIIPGYPVNWITTYESVEILATCDRKPMRAVSVNDVLTGEQISMLNKVDLGTDIVVNVKYKYLNPFSNVVENNEINAKVTAVPEKEAAYAAVPDNQAKYAGGYEQMTKYLDEKGILEIFKTGSKQLQHLIVGFTVNEEGEIANAKILTTSGDSKTDKLLLKAINKMPKWKPAENANGIKVKQDFQFSVGSGDGDGC